MYLNLDRGCRILEIVRTVFARDSSRGEEPPANSERLRRAI